jgi:hypothetical protein
MTAGFLVIVSRNRPDLYSYIQQLFFADPRYRLIFDRRRMLRRRSPNPRAASEGDRRRKDRRAKPEIDEEIRVQGWAVAASVDNPLDEVPSRR